MSFIVMGDLFSARERGKWQAVNNIGFATASAIGPTIGGVLSDNMSWRWIFLINVPLCLITLAVVRYGLQQAVRSSERRARDIDWFGALWSTTGVVAILLALTWGGREYSWTSPQMLTLLGVTVVAGLLLWRAERRASDPFIPTGIFNGGVVPFVCIGFFASFFVWFSMILLAPLRLQLVLGATATEAGALLTPDPQSDRAVSTDMSGGRRAAGGRIGDAAGCAGGRRPAVGADLFRGGWDGHRAPGADDDDRFPERDPASAAGGRHGSGVAVSAVRLIGWNDGGGRHYWCECGGGGCA
jgi:MFS family permease